MTIAPPLLAARPELLRVFVLCEAQLLGSGKPPSHRRQNYAGEAAVLFTFSFPEASATMNSPQTWPREARVVTNTWPF